MTAELKPKKYVVITVPNSLIVVCKDDQAGFWLERYDRPETYEHRKTPREKLGMARHVSHRMYNADHDSYLWLLDVFLDGYTGVLDDHSESVINDYNSAIANAVRALRDVQVAP